MTATPTRNELKDCREAYHEWVSRGGDPDWRELFERDQDGRYALDTANGGWIVWQHLWPLLQAAQNQSAARVRELEDAVAAKDKALLLAARWFKLNFDDDTLHEHPPSKADLAGMFDAMQEARAVLKGGANG